MTLKLLLLLALLAAACTPAAAPEPTQHVAMIKQIVTVEIPPSPNALQRQATFQALPRTPTAPPATITPTPTAYVGVFIARTNQEGQVFQPQAFTPQANLDIVCPIPIDSAFGEGWRGNAPIARRMGCPIQARFGFSGEVQVFEGGVMYSRTDINAVWAITPGSLTAGRYWYMENPIPFQPIPGIEPPSGLSIPTETFGSVWNSDLALRQALGYARTPRQTADLNIQRFEGGSLLLDVTVGQVFVLLADGDSYGPY